MTLSDPVGAGEIAKRAGVVKATVWSWQKRHSDFPAPWRQLEMGPVWDWADIIEWLGRHGKPSTFDRNPERLAQMRSALAAKQFEQEA